MLTLSFATRTDSTEDPLIQRILSMAMEFNDLTGTSLIVLRLVPVAELNRP